MLLHAHVPPPHTHVCPRTHTHVSLHTRVTHPGRSAPLRAARSHQTPQPVAAASPCPTPPTCGAHTQLGGGLGGLWVMGGDGGPVGAGGGGLWVMEGDGGPMGAGGGVLWVMGGYGGHSLSFCDPPPPISPSPSLTSRSAAPPPPPAPQGGNQRTARCPVCVWGGWGKRRGGGSCS